jgi:hypothetical protein
MGLRRAPSDVAAAWGDDGMLTPDAQPSSDADIPNPKWRRARYPRRRLLGQAFYSQLVAACWRNPAFPCLSAIAGLDYGEELVIRPESLSSLLHELANLPASIAVDDATALRGAGERARATGTTLWIAGDMHPVITRAKR